MKEQNKWVTVYRYPADSPKTWKELWLAATPVVGGPDSPLVDVLSVGNDAKWLVQFLNRGQIFQARIQRRSIQSNTILHVYHGTCKKCGGQYVGESTRKFKQRHSGHKQVKRKYGGLGHHYGGQSGCGYESISMQIIEAGDEGALAECELYWQHQLRCYLENGGKALSFRKDITRTKI